MKLKDLISKLRDLKDDHGDVVVTCHNVRGDDFPLEDINLCTSPDGSVYEINLYPY